MVRVADVNEVVNNVNELVKVVAINSVAVVDSVAVVGMVIVEPINEPKNVLPIFASMVLIVLHEEIEHMEVYVMAIFIVINVSDDLVSSNCSDCVLTKKSISQWI